MSKSILEFKINEIESYINEHFMNNDEIMFDLCHLMKCNNGIAYYNAWYKENKDERSYTLLLFNKAKLVGEYTFSYSGLFGIDLAIEVKKGFEHIWNKISINEN